VSPDLIVYMFIAALCLAGGFGVVTTRNVAHAALFLLLSLASVAGVFILLLAEFLALVQILIYGGAVTIVLLFALMLTRLEEFSQVTDNPQRPLAAVTALGLFGVIVAVIVGQRVPRMTIGGGDFESLGIELFTKWAIPFEIASLVLLVALVGAIIIARGEGSEE